VSPKLDISQYRLEGPVEDYWNLEGYVSHFSASSLSMLRRCPYQFQRRYLWGKKERPAESTTIGSAVHAGAERNYEWKIGSHEDLPLAELLEWYDDVGFDTVLARDQNDTGLEIEWDTDHDKAQRRGRSMLSAYRSEVTPRVQPIATEYFFEADMGLPVPMHGYCDVLTADSIIDLKTGKRKVSKPAAKWRMQAGIYSRVSALPVAFHSVTATVKTNTVNIVTPLEEPALLITPTFSEIARLQADLRAIVAEACLYMELYGPDEDWPTHGRSHDWACDNCGYRPTCPAWAE
jgi:hypothetical protein